MQKHLKRYSVTALQRYSDFFRGILLAPRLQIVGIKIYYIYNIYIIYIIKNSSLIFPPIFAIPPLT